MGKFFVNVIFELPTISMKLQQSMMVKNLKIPAGKYIPQNGLVKDFSEHYS